VSEDFVTVAALAREWGIDRSHARRYVLGKGFNPVRIRGNDPTHQTVNALSLADAELVREIRANEGYTAGSGSRALDNGVGVLYVVQTVPDLDPSRVKLGYATDANQRVRSYRTLSPTAAIVKTWPCRVTWELAAIDSLTAENCTPIGGEVYSCSDLNRLVQRGEAFFACMPSL